MSGPMLAVEDLVVRYGRSTVLHGVSFEVAAGSVVALMGRNGVGKTTAVGAVAGLLPVASGAVRIAGTDMTSWSPHRRVRSGVALVPQGRRLFAGLSVEENLLVALSRRQGSSAWTVPEVYDRFPQLGARRKVGATLLSGGEQQMLAIARAMVSGPRLVLMDEPSEGLAPVIVEQIREIVVAVRDAGGTVLIVEQNLELGLATADRVYLMSKGEIVAHGSPDDIRADAETMHRFLGVA